MTDQAAAPSIVTPIPPSAISGTILNVDPPPALPALTVSWKTGEFWLHVLAAVLSILFISGAITNNVVLQIMGAVSSWLGSLGFTVMRSSVKMAQMKAHATMHARNVLNISAMLVLMFAISGSTGCGAGQKLDTAGTDFIACEGGPANIALSIVGEIASIAVTAAEGWKAQLDAAGTKYGPTALACAVKAVDEAFGAALPLPKTVGQELPKITEPPMKQSAPSVHARLQEYSREKNFRYAAASK